MAYDAREAKRLLSDHLEKHEPSEDNIRRAWETLLGELAATCRDLGFEAHLVEPHHLKVQRKGGGVKATATLRDKHFVVRADGEQLSGEDRPLKLRFNRLTGMLEGEGDEIAIFPTPGELRPRRSAMAVVAQALTRALEVKDEPGASDRIGFSASRG
ncbi:MAG TPA: hypothetical protein VK447_08080 [Myxococcaceae bacterium]|nr:hypothetical protein [Myxococcaceae bacterium]